MTNNNPPMTYGKVKNLPERKVSIVNCYQDLRAISPGDIISVKGKSIESVIDPFREFGRVNSSKDTNFSKDEIYTVSMEGEYVTKNHYKKFSRESNQEPKPFLKTSFSIDSGTEMGNILFKIFKRDLL